MRQNKILKNLITKENQQTSFNAINKILIFNLTLKININKTLKYIKRMKILKIKEIHLI